MKITHKFQLDFLEKDGVTRLNAMQSDTNTRVVEVTLLEGGKAWTPAGATASVAFRNLKDGHKGWYDKLPNGDDACTVNGNVVTAVLAPAVLSGDGEVQAAIVFQDANLNQLATFGFSILVEKNPAAGNELRNDYYAYSTMEDVSAAVDAMLDSLEDTKAQLGLLVEQVNEAVAQVSQEAGPAIICEATGEVVAVADASNRALQGLSIFGKTTQNGTPSPSNPVPLVNVGSGGSIGVTVAGKNLLANTAVSQTVSGVTFTVNEDKSITTSGVATADIYYALTYNTALPIGKYFLSGTPQGASGVRIYIAPLYYADYGNGYAFSIENAGVFEAYIHIGNGADCNGLTFHAQIEEGMSATAYEPYKEQTLSVATPNGLPGIPVTSGGNYTDSNGQAWICDEIDLARGVYVQRIGTQIFTGAEAWWREMDGWGYDSTFYTSSQTGFSAEYFNRHIRNAFVMSDSFVGTNYDGLKGATSAGYVALAGSGMYIEFTSDHATVDAWKAWLAQQNAAGTPLTVRYVMAEPIETPLDADTLAAYAALHSNKPNTTVMNDAGAGQKLGYVADTKTYIDQKFTQLQSAIIAAIGTI